MAPNAKRVFYVKYLSGPVFGEILARRPDIQLDKLENETPDAEAEPILSQAHAYQIGASRQVIGKHLQVTDALLARTPNLVAVSSNGAGYDTIDVDACTRQGIIVVNQSGGNKEAVAEHALAMLLTLSKRIIEVDRRMRRAPDIPRNAFIGTELLDKTIGIIGIGNVGGRLAELCKGLFRMRVLAYDPYLSAAQIAAKGAEKVETLDEMLRQADYVSVNSPYTKETHNLMGAREFALMQPHAYFVTTARGGIHDEDALADALEAKKIAGAGLDVWEDEPPPHDHRLMAFDNVLVSPHTAGATHEFARQHGAVRGGTADRDPGRQASAAIDQPRGVACLLRSVRTDHGRAAARIAMRLPLPFGERAGVRGCPDTRMVADPSPQPSPPRGEGAWLSLSVAPCGRAGDAAEHRA